MSRRRVTVKERLCRIGMWLGVVSGFSVTNHHGMPWRVNYIGWTGHRLSSGKRTTPCYVLGIDWHEWACVLKYHHWPSPHKIAFGMCAKCVPCWACGEPAPIDHHCEGMD